MYSTNTGPGLLANTDPEPVQIVNGTSASPVFLLCEHAGNLVPTGLSKLGVSHEVLNSHRGWDIGAAEVAKGTANLLGAPLVLQRYSRLVIDCNRPPRAPGSIPEVSDNVTIPSNQNVQPQERALREREIFVPLHRAVQDALDQTPRRAVFSIHSFTPEMNGEERPWHAGFLSRKSAETAKALMASVARAAPSTTLALNQPYQIEDDSDWFIPQHAEARGLSHCLIEIRNDQLRKPEGVEHWSNLLANAITGLLETLT